MGALPTAMALLFMGELQADVLVGATFTQRVGEIPTGTATVTVSSDTELRPELRVTLADDRWSATVTYDPRLLLRVQFPPGEDASILTTSGDRPILILHSLRGQTRIRFDPRWTWTNDAFAIFGEQDFAAFLQGGAGAGTGPASSRSGALVEAQVIQSSSVNVVSTLVSPFFGHDSLRTSLSLNVSQPEAELGLMEVAEDPMMEMPGGEDDPNDQLCFGDPSGAVEVDPNLAAIASTCQISLRSATVSRLSELDTLEVQGAYEALDFDPGTFIHLVSADVLWRRRLSRTAEFRVRGGLILPFDTNPAEGDDSVRPLPRLDLGLAWPLLNLRLLQLTMDLELGADGFLEAVSRQYLLRVSGTAALNAVIRRDLTVGLRVNGFALGPERECPPRQPVLGTGMMESIPAGGCLEGLPEEQRDAARLAEIPDLTSFSSELSLTWRVDPNVSLLGNARYAFRAPHVSRFGQEDPAAAAMMGVQSQREISGQIGIRVTYATNNNLGGS